MQNAEYDKFNPNKHTLKWADEEKLLTTPDQWILSKVQKLVRNYTKKSEECEFNFALAELEEFVVNLLSREYVPMVRKDLWSDEPETLNRRLAVYATLWYTLKTLVLLFNPITPFMSETLHQAVYKKLDDTLAQTVNLENWPTPNTNLENDVLEKEFTILQQTLPIVYSARQNANLKRRWPLAKVTIVAPKEIQNAITKLETLFLELANVKTVQYAQTVPEVDPELWATASEGETQALVYKVRDDSLEGEGLMRDLARRVQALRKDLGFSPTDIVDVVHIAELELRNVELLQPYLPEMEELVRTKKIKLHDSQDNLDADWHEDKLDKKKLYIAVK